MSELEERLAWLLRVNGFPEPMREFRFDPSRKWRVDFCWIPQLVAVECEGSIYTGGRHTTGVGFERDCYKYNALAYRGWTLFRFTGKMIMDSPWYCLGLIKGALDGQGLGDKEAEDVPGGQHI